MDTEVIKLTTALKGIFKVLEELYGKGSNTGKNLRTNAEESHPTNEGNNTAVVQQPVHQLPVDIGVTGLRALDDHAGNNINDESVKVSGSFTDLQLFSGQTEMPMQSGGVLYPQVVNAEPISDKDRIKQLEQELRNMQRNSNVNFNFAPVTIGGATNGQSNN